MPFTWDRPAGGRLHVWCRGPVPGRRDLQRGRGVLARPVNQVADTGADASADLPYKGLLLYERLR